REACSRWFSKSVAILRIISVVISAVRVSVSSARGRWLSGEIDLACQVPVSRLFPSSKNLQISYNYFVRCLLSATASSYFVFRQARSLVTRARQKLQPMLASYAAEVL